MLFLEWKYDSMERQTLQFEAGVSYALILNHRTRSRKRSRRGSRPCGFSLGPHPLSLRPCHRLFPQTLGPWTIGCFLVNSSSTFQQPLLYGAWSSSLTLCHGQNVCSTLVHLRTQSPGLNIPGFPPRIPDLGRLLTCASSYLGIAITTSSRVKNKKTA